MDELDFTISASGDFGNFMWEYPDKIKEIFRQLSELPSGEEAVRSIMECQKKNLLALLHIQLGILHVGRLAPILAASVKRHLKELAEEGLKLH